MSHLGLDEAQVAAEERVALWRRLGPSPGKPRGNGETIRWIAALVLAGIVGYFTTQVAMQSKVAVLEEREQNHYQELKDLLDEIRSDVKELRNGK